MLHVISFSRLGLVEDTLIKAWQKPVHKYWKRERAWRGNKLGWRYYYNTPEDRDRWKHDHDPKGEHEHVARAEVPSLFESLGRDLAKTASVAVEALKNASGAGDVRITGAFDRRHRMPFVRAEKSGLAVERNPIQRVKTAFERIPESIKKLARFNEITLATREELPEELGADVPAVHFSKGRLYLIADGEGHAGRYGFNTVPHGDPFFGSGLTLTEELIWHQVGERMRQRFVQQKRRAELDAFKKLHDNPHLHYPSMLASQSWEDDFAQSFAMFLSYPKLMAKECPERYDFFAGLGLAQYTREEILTRPDSEFAWWNSREPTKAQMLYEKAVAEQTPATVYRSSQDEFFSVAVNGRMVYFRMGPTSVDDEPLWDPLPSVIDPKTGLPTYDKKVAQRFRQEGAVKEVFDDHGNRLDDVTAFLYLRHDDNDVNAAIPEDIRKYKFAERRGEESTIPATHGLAYQIYLALGESRGDADTERKAVEKYTKAGTLKENREDRYQWAPIKLTEAEWFAKTPTFIFDRMREAKEQPFVALEDGKQVIGRNAQTGKKGPLLHARVYEVTTPDGSVAKVTVKESPAFAYGETIELPVRRDIVDATTGDKQTKTVWERVELHAREHPDLTLRGLAKQYQVPPDEILMRNGKLQQYQITDPIMAALVNPIGEPIRGLADLIAMFKHAAENLAEAWVSIAVGNDVPSSTVHAKVRFDGAGSPLLVGEHWKRKLGKDKPRVSDLIRGGQLRGVERVIDRTPTKAKVEPGATVYARVGDKTVLARLEAKLPLKGFRVQVLPGQDLEVGSEVASQVRGIPESVDVTRPNVYLRSVRQPQHDLLVYADEIQKDPKGNIIPGTGTNKILLPSDGTWTFDEVLRMPGVRASEKGELLLDVASVDDFRERVGGFVMDEHTQIRLHRLLQSERVRLRSAKEMRIPLSKIADTNGVAKTDGLLKGMRKEIGGRPFRLGSHQVEGLQAIAQNLYRKLVAWSMGTGKTPGAIAAFKMAKNEGMAKRCLIVVPPGLVKNWQNEVNAFTDQKATIIGTEPGQYRMWDPKDLTGKALDEARKEAHKSPSFWKGADQSDITVVGREYFVKHKDELRRLGNFDFMVVDEGQGIQNDNSRSRAIEEFNADLNGLLILTGTPFTNKLGTMPQYFRLLSKGTVDLGTPKQFSEAHLVESSVMKANGARRAARMDVNPHSLRFLNELLHRFVDVKTPYDVRGKIMPAILTDENQPRLMTGTQSLHYKGNMKALTPESHEQLATSATLGEDEREVIRDPDGRRRVVIARNISNCLAYKAPDNRKFVTFKRGEGKAAEEALFKLPSFEVLERRFKGRWPSEADVDRGRLEANELREIEKWVGYALDVDYDSIAGRSLTQTTTKAQLRAIQSGEPVNGMRFGAKVENPEYGPEGAIARGVLVGNEIKDIEHTVRNPDGSVREKIVVPTGFRFQRHLNGLYYAGGLPEGRTDAGKYTNDWDYSKQVVDEVEGFGTEEEDKEHEKEVIERGQRPKPGSEGESVNRSPRRRRERLMFDLAMTTGNAKSDAMEEWIHNNQNPKVGGDPDTQMVMFGHNVGSAIRAMESKLRLMGYQDVNEALNAELHAPSDKPPPTGKYFATYLGGNDTLGDRELNVDVFRKAKDADGRDTKMSLFVHKMLHGSDGKPPKVGQIVGIWEPAERKTIERTFTGVEAPARVTAVETPKGIEYRYAYHSSLNPRESAEVHRLERIPGADAEKKVNEIYARHWSAKEPLTERQINVFNNTNFLVCSDAGQTGLNLGNATRLGSYDSLFSPMEEFQRYTRIARMRDPLFRVEMEPHFAAVSKQIDKMTKATKLREYQSTQNAALAIVNDALDTLPEARKALAKSGMSPSILAEAILTQRAFDRIIALRPEVEHKLRTEGRIIEGAPAVRDPITGEMRPQAVKPAEITSQDVTNEIIEKRITPWERELLKSRKYLAQVKRFITSAEVPKYEINVETYETTDKNGKVTKRKRKVKTIVGTEIEMPSKAEKSILMLGRAKQVPIERLFAAAQNELPTEPRYDYVTTNPSSLASFAKPIDETATEDLETRRAERQRQRELRARLNRKARERAKHAAESRRKMESEQAARKRLHAQAVS